MNSNIIGKKILLTGVNGMLCEDIIKLFKNKNAFEKKTKKLSILTGNKSTATDA